MALHVALSGQETGTYHFVTSQFDAKICTGIVQSLLKLIIALSPNYGIVSKLLIVQLQIYDCIYIHGTESDHYPHQATNEGYSTMAWSFP